MKKIKIHNEVLVFVSDVYYGVNITVLTSCSECIIVDTGMNKKEILEVINYIEDHKLHIRYLVYTHTHFDHIFGVKWIAIKNIKVVAHSCFEKNLLLNICNLEDSKELDYSLRMPDVTFDSTCKLNYGNSSVLLISTPGHTSDSLVVFETKKGVLIAGDTVNYIPYICWGDLVQLNNTLKNVYELSYQCLVMGHYGMVSYIESKKIIESNINYIKKIEDDIDKIVKSNFLKKKDDKISIELNEILKVPDLLYYKNCDYSFIEELHKKNIMHLLKNKIHEFLK